MFVGRSKYNTEYKIRQLRGQTLQKQKIAKLTHHKFKQQQPINGKTKGLRKGSRETSQRLKVGSYFHAFVWITKDRLVNSLFISWLYARKEWKDKWNSLWTEVYIYIYNLYYFGINVGCCVGWYVRIKLFILLMASFLNSVMPLRF